MAAKDIILIDDDLEINETGDFRLGFSDEQSIDHILRAYKGEFRQAPTIGVGIALELNSPLSNDGLEAKIRRDLDVDSWSIASLLVSSAGSDKKITINANKNL